MTIETNGLAGSALAAGNSSPLMPWAAAASAALAGAVRWKQQNRIASKKSAFARRQHPKFFPMDADVSRDILSILSLEILILGRNPLLQKWRQQ
jgi:hypothetical protein